MAVARIKRLAEAVPGATPGRVNETYEVLFVGADVHGGADTDFVEVMDVDYTLQPAQIAAYVAAAIRTRAGEIGHSIGANAVLMPELTKG